MGLQTLVSDFSCGQKTCRDKCGETKDFRDCSEPAQLWRNSSILVTVLSALRNVQIVFAVPLAHDHQRLVVWVPVRRSDTWNKLVPRGKSSRYERRAPAKHLVGQNSRHANQETGAAGEKRREIHVALDAGGEATLIQSWLLRVGSASGRVPIGNVDWIVCGACIGTIPFSLSLDWVRRIPTGR
jgi:hypothetical protein